MGSSCDFPNILLSLVDVHTHTYIVYYPLCSYACTKSGHVFEIHYSSVSLGRVWHLLPGNDSVEKEGCVAITALCLHEAFAVTGSEDGVLRVWPTDFSSVFLEGGKECLETNHVTHSLMVCVCVLPLEHEACVSAVGISEDGMKILAATASVSTLYMM